MEGRNLLTEKLLKEGYTKDNHPNYVKWYDNMHEFEYTNEFLINSTWEAPCGIMQKGEFTNGYGWINGVCFRVENNNYNYGCPYRKNDCEFFHSALKNLNWGGKCAWHLTDKPYDYDNSAEKIENEKRELIAKNLNIKFGHPSMIHCVCCHINDDTCEPYFEFNPNACIRFMENGCDNKTCYCTGKARNLKKGNIYYDVKVSTEFREGFIVEPRINITKGKKFFDNPKDITDLELYLKLNPDDIMRKERGKREHSNNLFRYEDCNGPKYEIEIINVRVESKESRDLMQDLQDIRDGIEVTHESDNVKAGKAQKSQKRSDAKEKKISKLETKILKLGYDGLEAADKRRARKLIKPLRVKELEKERRKPKPVKPVQMELSDFLVM